MRKWFVVCAMLLVGCTIPDGSNETAADSSRLAKQVGDTVAVDQKACALLSADDVSAITGVKHTTGIPTHDYGGSTQCRYDREDRTQGIMFTTHAHGDIENYRRVPGSIAVANLGDGAVWNDATSQLAVRHGDAVISISFLTPPSNLQLAINLARRALPRIQ